MRLFGINWVNLRTNDRWVDSQIFVSLTELEQLANDTRADNPDLIFTVQTFELHN